MNVPNREVKINLKYKILERLMRKINYSLNSNGKLYNLFIIEPLITLATYLFVLILLLSYCCIPFLSYYLYC